MLVINNSIQQVICEIDFLEVLHLFQHMEHSHMHVHTSLFVNIFYLNELILNISLHHVLRDDNRCTFFFANLGRSLRLGDPLALSPVRV